MKGGVNALSYSDSKQVPICCWINEETVVFQSSDEAQLRTYELRRLSEP